MSYAPTNCRNLGTTQFCIQVAVYMGDFDSWVYEKLYELLLLILKAFWAKLLGSTKLSQWILDRAFKVVSERSI